VVTSTRDARRREILQELGLTPVWRSRANNPPESSVQALSPASAEAAASGEPLCTVSVTTVPVTAPVDAAEDRRLKILRMGWDELEESISGCIA